MLDNIIIENLKKRLARNNNIVYAYEWAEFTC
jgi:hypothetical protein